MSHPLQTSTLHALNEAGIIKAAQYRHALAHPMFSELANYDDPAEYLMWLVCRDIMPEDQLKATCARATASRIGEDLKRHGKALSDAVLMLDDFREKLTRQMFDTLVAENLLTERERDAALRDMSSDMAFISPGHALAWIARFYGIGSARLTPEAVRAATGSSKHIAILVDASDRYARTRPAPESASPGARFLRPTWLWIGALAFLMLFILK